jgi:DtxR family transcriptional regulator, Mn-dependent transcriptional regulator
MATTVSPATRRHARRVDETRQEYLESIYWLYEAGIERSPTNLARALQVSPPSVTEMVRNMEKEGLVTRAKNKRISLTPKGEEIAKHVVDRHRLVEAFLVKVMGIPWDEVHEEAEAFEMGVTDELARRMLDLIGDVKTCPHGHPIGDYPRTPGMPLTAAAAGSRICILRFENEDHNLLRTFMRAGVEPQAVYEILRHDSERTHLRNADGADTSLPLYAARTISVSVEQAGDGEPAEHDPESLATAYLLGESHWSR